MRGFIFHKEALKDNFFESTFCCKLLVLDGLYKKTKLSRRLRGWEIERACSSEVSSRGTRCVERMCIIIYLDSTASK